ncbi:PREDICTED: E3 ubiquitin-protein ligase CHIP isoform X2 [Tarenaya hassleriana]|uniref:E3 ubiquitin-protein ligase CHIP isoform X2 n=1 Tax=Tarenaya hassleriana TaxID=28532 RepID=UPI00053C86A6|nr:PREDICTED: E3 ubiquitin-protein ligase CHIP isoform X2 [Tarenaya hassleriana]
MVSARAKAAKAERLTEEGNIYFSEKLFGLAIDAYTRAKDLCPNVSAYWTNRARCHQMRNDWTKVEKDCLNAIKVDNNSVKGHYMLGLALLQKEDKEGGLKELQMALNLERVGNPTGSLVKEIWKEIAKEKYKEWEQLFAERELELRNLKEACEDALNQKHDLVMSENPSDEAIASSHSKQLEALERFFQKAAEDDRTTKVPDYLCCMITLEIFQDPVITPSGVTYERAAILEHLDKLF